jgi:hypothetical protein
VLVCVGTDDPLISVLERLAFEEEMRAGGVDWRMNLYGGTEHSFTNPASGLTDRPGVMYHHLSDERSWRAMLDLLDEVFAERIGTINRARLSEHAREVPIARGCRRSPGGIRCARSVRRCRVRVEHPDTPWGPLLIPGTSCLCGHDGVACESIPRGVTAPAPTRGTPRQTG